MANLTCSQYDGISRSNSTLPPSHYIVKIQSFSSLDENISELYNSGEFEAGGYKWKLIIHPKGNIKTNVNDHISLYLRMVVNETSLHTGSQVHAILRFFLLDQKNQNYLVIQVPMKCFDWMKHEWGVDRLVSFKDFENPTNGYLVNDTCVFGAEVYVRPNFASGKVDRLSMVKTPISYTHTWKIDNFYKLGAICIDSTTFIVGEQKWKIQMYPKGYSNGAGTHISLYLRLADTTSLPPGHRVYAENTLRIVDQNSATDSIDTPLGKRWYCEPTYGTGRHTYISLDDLNSPNKGYIKNKSCIVEAIVTVYGVKNAF